ncbi:hypothetical protein M404DRAFT_19501 [Pisolithus tinctorius Marx 270]|uniref:Secreted protein n=1 Tax=Pisolithus tinctorius Marx 270 TaxID=870435 RepID=A0A0C3KTD2_PISTI|nr:hypothetical protein M404DRAFT_19501 [Pisolithus tinctorius Marx 270]
MSAALSLSLSLSLFLLTLGLWSPRVLDRLSVTASFNITSGLRGLCADLQINRVCIALARSGHTKKALRLPLPPLSLQQSRGPAETLSAASKEHVFSLSSPLYVHRRFN